MKGEADMKRKRKKVYIEVRVPPAGPEAALTLRRYTGMDDRRVDARNRTRTERNRRALED